MEVINEVVPSDRAQMEAMMEKGPDEPIFMLNLLKFKERAEYEDGRETDFTGREAYMIYGEEVTKILSRFGGVAIFGADVTHLALGKVEELWDEIAFVAYKDRAALLKMSISDEWQAISVHRTAGLQGQLNIESTLMMQGGLNQTFMTDIADDLAGKMK